MAPKSTTVPAGIVRLQKLITHLKAPPKLVLTGVKSLRLSLAYKNDHFGARHFLKENLPRIRFANPNLDIQVQQARKTVKEQWRPEMELELEDGRIQTLDLQDKWSTTILKELMDLAGGNPWKQHVEEATKAGMPVIPGSTVHEKTEQRTRKDSKPLPSLKEYMQMHSQTQKAAPMTATNSTTPPPSYSNSGVQ